MITGKRNENLGAILQIRQHQIVAGVSEKMGGRDEGPTPHELVEAALAACTIITVQMYANRKQMKLESTQVSVKITSEAKTGTEFSREISFVGDLSDEERQRLLEIADKCPIHKLLSGPIAIQTKLI